MCVYVNGCITAAHYASYRNLKKIYFANSLRLHADNIARSNFPDGGAVEASTCLHLNANV